MANASFRGHNPYRFAVIGLVAILAAVTFAYAWGTLGLGQGGYEMSGVFAGAGGLETGDEVQVAGVVVGKVTGISPDFQHGYVVITWKVNDGIELGPQTHADVEAANLLGGQYIKLSGPVVRPYASSLPASRRRIPLSRTSIPYTLNQAINSATGIATQLDTASINKILKEAAALNPPSRDQLATMLKNLGDLTTTLNERAPEVEAIIANSRNLTATLASKDTQLGQLLTYGQSLLGVLAQRRDDLAAALGNGATVVSTLDRVIAQHQADLDSVLKNLHSAVGVLSGPNLAGLNVDMAWLGPTFVQLSETRGNGRWLEGGLSGLGPLQPNLFGPEPSFQPPNYPYPGVPTAPPSSGGSKGGSK
jgi:phospholipid/cholesterol/gamma-HCH transport system substrate-binding protein